MLTPEKGGDFFKSIFGNFRMTKTIQPFLGSRPMTMGPASLSAQRDGSNAKVPVLPPCDTSEERQR